MAGTILALSSAPEERTLLSFLSFGNVHSHIITDVCFHLSPVLRRYPHSDLQRNLPLSCNLSIE